MTLSHSRGCIEPFSVFLVAYLFFALHLDVIKKLYVLYLLAGIYKAIPLFQGLSDVFFEKLYQRTSLFVIPPNYDVLRNEDHIYYLRVISRGYCKMYSHIPIDKAHGLTNILKPGDAFPVLEFLHDIPSFIRVVTLTAVELFYIKRRDVLNAMQFESIFHSDLLNVIAKHRVQKGKTLNKVQQRLPEFLPEEKSLGGGKYFTYTISDEYVVKCQEEKKRKRKHSFENLGKMGRVLHYTMLPITIHPESKFYMCWEILVCLLIFARLIMESCKYNVLASCYHKKCYWAIMSLDVLLYLDMYIRLHIGYYNKKGLLITHPYYTAVNYVYTNFPIDVLVMVPYYWLQMTKIFGKRHEFLTDVIITITIRTLQMYHIFRLLSYFKLDCSKALSIVLNVIKVFVLLTITILLFTNLFVLLTCTFDNHKFTYKCARDGWQISTFVGYNESIYPVFLMSLYITISGFTTAMTGAFTLSKKSEIVVFCMLIIIGVIVRTYFVAIITSAGVSVF